MRGIRHGGLETKLGQAKEYKYLGVWMRPGGSERAEGEKICRVS